MSTSYKCPKCAANLIFDADQQMMTCNFCGAKIEPENMIATAVTLDTQAMKEEDARDREIRDEGNENASPLHEKSSKAIRNKRALKYKTEKEYAAFTEEDSVQYVCGSCGAAVITDKNTSSTFCAFCGSPAIITERLADARKPDYIIPFKYGRDKAVQSFFKWCHSGYLTPFDFVKKENIEKMTGLYVPFWLFNSVADMDYVAMGSKQFVDKQPEYTQTTTKFYKITRRGKICWKMFPFDGASHIDDEQMRAIAPFDYKEIKDFDMAYLAGFFADRYDVSSKEMDHTLNLQIASFMDKVFEKSVAEYLSVFSKRNNSKIDSHEVKYALLPVWVLNYKYQGQIYTFAMNGQTGKTAGYYPISLVKLFLILMALLPIAAVLVRLLIGGLILGGIF